jgi:two-component system, OmpR family, response regulator
MIMMRTPQRNVEQQKEGPEEMDTVLIVDDDPAIREIFSTYLEMGGYRVLAAAGGADCLELLKTHNPDIILLDLMMEPMDGWETLLAIRKNNPSCGSPVIIITGKHPVPGEILQYGGYIEDFIQKPVDFKQVVISLNRIIAKERDRDREINRIEADLSDPQLLGEYLCLLRLVGVVRSLCKRLRDHSLTDCIPLTAQEERLLVLHRKLGLPDTLLDREAGG